MTIVNNWPWVQPHINIVQPQPQVNIIHAPRPNLGEAFKPERAGEKPSHVVFVLDDSGSMQSVRSEMISAYNEFVDAQKTDADKNKIPTYVSLYKFDGVNVTCVYSYTPVEHVSPLTKETYDPHGMTNLYDGIGGVLMEINKRLAETPKTKRDSILVAILTDGAENSSKVFSSADVKQMVSKAEDANWGFQFFGANVDAFAVGGNLGFHSQNTMQFNVQNVGATMRAASRMSNDMKMAYARGLDTISAYTTATYSADERSSAIGNDDD